MMRLCTLTGVDEQTSFEWIHEMSARYPFVEFGILLSANPDPEDKRYVSMDFIDKFADSARSGMVNTAVHVCGRAVSIFVGGNRSFYDICARFGRVQLNFNAQRATFAVEDLDVAIREFSRPVITQENEANAGVAAQISAPNHHVLFDASGGRGMHARSFPARGTDKFYGYAGGFGPETVVEDLEGAAAASQGRPFWIDMESRLRTDGLLDRVKCETVLSRVAQRLK